MNAILPRQVIEALLHPGVSGLFLKNEADRLAATAIALYDEIERLRIQLAQIRAIANNE